MPALISRLITFSFVVAVALVSAPLAHATFPGQNGKFAFSQNGSIYTVNPDGSDIRQIVPANSGETNLTPAWSPDGQKLAFARNSSSGSDIYVIDADGANQTRLTPGTFRASSPTWSPSGDQLAFLHSLSATGQPRAIATMNAADGSGVTVIAAPPDTFSSYTRPKWSPEGSRIAFDHNGEVLSVEPDGVNLANLTGTSDRSEYWVDWAPDGNKLLFFSGSGICCSGHLDIDVMNADGSGRVNVASDVGSQNVFPYSPLWSPDGSLIVFVEFDGPVGTGIYSIQPTGGTPTYFADAPSADGFASLDLDWQPASTRAPLGFPRPRGATPTRVSLVVAYAKCNAPDRTHGEALAYPSCSQPQARSSYLTVGTPDANGEPAKAAGSISFNATVGDPSTSVDEADVAVTASVTDVRDRLRMSDYIAELRAVTTVRLTDRSPGVRTTTDFPLGFSVPCTSTGDSTVGSTCTVATTIDALTPGAIKEGSRGIWQLGPVQLFDGGEDGEGATESDNTLFMKQGIFVP